MRDIYIFAVWTKDPKDLKDVGSNLKGYLAPLVQALLRCEMSSNINYYYIIYPLISHKSLRFVFHFPLHFK